MHTKVLRGQVARFRRRWLEVDIYSTVKFRCDPFISKLEVSSSHTPIVLKYFTFPDKYMYEGRVHIVFYDIVKEATVTTGYQPPLKLSPT